jgi:hypothetical protein
MSKKICIALAMMIWLLLTLGAGAENYVNWRGGFWISLPDGWEKVDYRLADQYLSMMDTSNTVFNYEAIFAPKTSDPFVADAYLVITFDSIGQMSPARADSFLTYTAKEYSRQIFEAPIVQLMSDLTPGQPKINREEKSLSVLSEMAYRSENKRYLWLFMRVNDRGVVSLYCYCPEKTFERNKAQLEGIIKSLSFEGLKEAAGEEKGSFTQIKGNENPVTTPGGGSSSGLSGSMLIIILVVAGVIVLALVWFVVIRPRINKGTPAA